MNTELRTVNIAPTWRTAVTIYLNALESGTEEGKRLAREEFYRMADALDQHNEKSETT